MTVCTCLCSQLSVGVLRASGIALAVKPLQNDPDFTLSTAASALIARWKAQLKVDKESRKEKLKEPDFARAHTHTHTHPHTLPSHGVAGSAGASQIRRIASRGAGEHVRVAPAGAAPVAADRGGNGAAREDAPPRGKRRREQQNSPTGVCVFVCVCVCVCVCVSISISITICILLHSPLTGW